MGLFTRLFGRWRDDSPAGQWLARRAKANPEDVVQEHFQAMIAHDLDWIMATLTPERGRLYTGPTTLDRRRRSIRAARITAVEPAPEAPVTRVVGYKEQLVLRVSFELELVSSEERRDPTLTEGSQWAYYLLVRERPGRPWLIADWGR